MRGAHETVPFKFWLKTRNEYIDCPQNIPSYHIPYILYVDCRLSTTILPSAALHSTDALCVPYFILHTQCNESLPKIQPDSRKEMHTSVRARSYFSNQIIKMISLPMGAKRKCSFPFRFISHFPSHPIRFDLEKLCQTLFCG